ncbi:MAG: hypothetical protein WBC51_14360 [Vicinamibacterales bacterium]
MRAHLLLGVAIIAGIFCNVSAQTRTEEGVVALARGDYLRAVEILRPIAEDWRSTDRTAQFFMAGLYETGRGVPLDPLRACALYMRASSTDSNPFGQQAAMMLPAMMGQGEEFNAECQLLANVGFDHGLEPVTFDLGPGHFVELTVSAVSVTYQGRTRREPTAFTAPGARFLPPQYTELATGPTRSLRRHFIDGFMWRPSTPTGPPWELFWGLSEVVDHQIIGIETSGPLATVDGDAPPPRESFNVREYAVVRVDDEGNAEWAVLKGPRRMTQRIETEAERREVREMELARDAALKRVDWSRQYDVARSPAMSYVDSGGCGNFHLYGWTADRAEAVSVRVDAPALGLSTDLATFDLSRQSANISVQTYVYASSRRQFDFCSDVRIPEAVEPVAWRAVAGTITIELSPHGIRAATPNARRATVTLTNVVLRNGAGTTLKIVGPVRLTAIVGQMFSASVRSPPATPTMMAADAARSSSPRNRVAPPMRPNARLSRARVPREPAR